MPTLPQSVTGKRLFLLAIAVVLIPSLYLAMPQEMSRWCEAIALESHLEDDIDRAIVWGERGLRLDRQNQSLRSRVATWKVADGTADDAIADADLVLDQARRRYARSPSTESAQSLANALNQAAYFRALAEIDLPTAKQQIAQAINLLTSATADAALESYLDTRGYIAHLLGEHDAAHADMEMAVQLLELNLDLRRVSIRQQSQMAIDQRPFRMMGQDLDHTAAVMYQHRGLTFESLGKLDQSRADFKRAKALGYNPQQGVW